MNIVAAAVQNEAGSTTKNRHDESIFKVSVQWARVGCQYRPDQSIAPIDPVEVRILNRLFATRE